MAEWDRESFAAPEVIKGTSGTYDVDTHFRKLIGSGSFGEVYRGLGENGEKLAVKRIAKKPNVNIDHISDVSDRLLGIEHDKVVQIFDIKREEDMVWVVMQYCEGGNMEEYFKNRKPGFDEILRFLAEITLGVDVLHKNMIIHRDIKPANILLSGGTLKLADFELSKSLAQGSWKLTTSTGLGTVAFQGPEFFLRTKDDNIEYTQMADIFSLGLTFLSMLQYKQGAPHLEPKIESLKGKVDKAIGQVIAGRMTSNIIVKHGCENIILAVVAGVLGGAALSVALAATIATVGGVPVGLASIAAVGFPIKAGLVGKGAHLFFLKDTTCFISYSEAPFNNDDNNTAQRKKKRSQLRKLIQSMVAPKPKKTPLR